MAKLRNRYLTGVPEKLLRRLATHLTLPWRELHTFLSGPPRMQVGGEYASSGKPEAFARESFQDAVRKSTLSDAEKAKWLD